MDSPLEQARALIAQNEFDKAEELLGNIVARQPRLFLARYLLGQLLEHTHQVRKAIEFYSETVKLLPGHAAPHTRLSILRLREYPGLSSSAPCKAADSGVRGRISMSTLGMNGRFGNQLLQYGFLRMYAESFQLRVETPEWIGQYIYGFNYPRAGNDLPGIEENGDFFVKSLNSEVPETLVNRDIWGFCCYHTLALSGYRDLFQSIYTPAQALMPQLEQAHMALKERGSTIIVLHLRRGDFGEGIFWVAPEEWYINWLEEIWGQCDSPVLYIASDEPDKVLAAFKAYNPVIATDISSLIPGIEFMHDFYLMTRADYLAISNSTFSFSASMINRNAKCFFRPDRTMQKLVEYDPWNADVFLP